MRVARIGLMVVVAVSAFGLAPDMGSRGGSAFAAPPSLRQPATLTGSLVERVFVRDCKCYPWVIEKNNVAWEVDISAVQHEARALAGLRVKATGRWSTYQRDGQTIRFFKIEILQPA